MSQSRRQIVKSTGLVGVGQVLAILVNMVRVKALAVLVGTAGMGVAGLYLSTIDLMCVVSGMGISISGVRYVAAASDAEERSATIAAIRRLMLILGVLGSFAGLLLSPWLARFTFGSELERPYAIGMAIVAPAVLLRNVSSSHITVLQGQRKIVEMASAKVLGAILGAISGILAVWILGMRGIPLYLLCVAAGTLTGSWLFARKYEGRTSPGDRDAVQMQSKKLIATGSAAMGGALVTTLGAYLIRLIVQRSIGLPAVGIYQATWVLGTLYVGVVLEAMGADFFPRLSSAQADDEASRRAINEQMEVGVLLAFPGVLFLVVMAPWILELLYAADFRYGAALLRWQLLGVALRAISWPIGFFVLSRAMNWTFVATEVLFNATYLAATWAGIERWGLEVVGLAFAAAYLVLLLVQWGIARHAIRFRLNSASRWAIGWSFSVLVGVVLGFQAFGGTTTLALGAAALVVYTAWAVRRLLEITNMSLADLWTRVRRKLG